MHEPIELDRSATPTEPMVLLEDVHLTLESRAGEVNILRGIELTIEKGESVGVVGPSGSGKSTMLAVTAGLERTSSGRVVVAGTAYDGLTEDALALFRRHHIGIVFQAFHLIPAMTALENVAVPLELSGIEHAFERARAGLTAVALEDRLDHYPAQLSGGEQQRVALARAFATGSALILADEPTGNLDMTTGRQIIDLMFEIRAHENSTLMLITHDPAVADRCDRVIHLNDGRITHPSHEAVAAVT